MKKVFLRYGMVLAGIVSLAGLKAQNFPVQATVQLVPPYSLYLEDYASVSGEKLSLMLFLKELDRLDYRVRLRLSIEGNAVRLQTTPNYIPPPVLLQGGAPLRLTGNDLAGYLDPNNLTFTGISRQEFQKTGRLPEGFYRVCIEVLDYNLGVVVSNLACANAWLILNDPPLVNLPQNNTKLRATYPQNIVFQWTPRHTASPNAASNVEYYFRLVEIWPAGRNPFDAINVASPIHEATLTSTSLIYGPAETPLVSGRQYAFRIQARQQPGFFERDLFKNQGFSEVYTFTYGDECLLPRSFTAEAQDAGRIRLNWLPEPGHTEFAVSFREEGSQGEWSEQETFLNFSTISSLRAGTTYEIKVSGQCGTVKGPVSEIITATTLSREESDFVCGASSEIAAPANTEPLATLNPGDVIRSADFEIEILEADGGGGIFSGRGAMVLPFMNYVKVTTTFTNISINTDRQVTDGNIIVTGLGTR